MEKISCIIVDDEIQNQEVLNRMLEQFCPTVEIAGRASSVDEAILLIDKFKPKIVFLDVEMPGGSGFTLFDRITNPAFFTIFTTAHADYAIRAIKIAALDFLLKPINLTELRIAVEKVGERLRNQSDNDQTNTKKIEVLNANKRGTNFEFKKIALPTTEGLEFYLVKDILRCEADRAYCIFHMTGKRRIVVSKSLKEYVDILEEASFFRVHKSNMVNVQHITKYIRGKGGHVLLNDGSLVAVAVRKKEELLGVLAHYNVTE